MIRILLAAWLLRTTGARVEYRVQRTKNDKTTAKDGTTILRTPSLREARTRYRNLRVAENDTVLIRVVGIVEQRHGKVVAK